MSAFGPEFPPPTETILTKVVHDILVANLLDIFCTYLTCPSCLTGFDTIVWIILFFLMLLYFLGPMTTHFPTIASSKGITEKAGKYGFES